MFQDSIFPNSTSYGINSRRLDTSPVDQKILLAAMISMRVTVTFAQVHFNETFAVFQELLQNSFLATHACSKKDPLTGLVKQEFKTPHTLPQTIGGWTPVSSINLN